MKPLFNIPKFLIFYLLAHTFLSTNLFGQNWFPLEVGNRWDFSYFAWCHGGQPLYDTISVEVLGDTILNGREYFVLSRSFPIAAYERYLRVENDSLYCFRNSSASDCLMYAFNKIIGTKYYACRFQPDSVLFFDEFSSVIFSYPDTVQQHRAYDYDAWTSLRSNFSKKFGILSIGAYDPICDGFFQLGGCIISGITYGQLLVSVEGENSGISSFKLAQNYPNPFNTSTKIEYTIAENSLLTLKVFDVLGREVSTLVSEEKPPGEYKVEFNGANLTSGIYFYQLKTRDYVSTKKMVLLK